MVVMFDGLVNNLFLKYICYFFITFFVIIRVNKSGKISWGVVHACGEETCIGNYGEKGRKKKNNWEN